MCGRPGPPTPNSPPSGPRPRTNGNSHGLERRGFRDTLSDMTIQERLTPGKYKLRVEDYACLGDAGVFGDAQTELIGGEIIVMSPEWRPHMRIKDELAYCLRRALEDMGSPLFVGTGGSVALGDHEMPRPDIILTNDVEGDGAIPGESVPLAIEISASTLDYDLGEKRRLYAAGGIPEYWVVDVDARLIEQMWSPVGEAYSEGRKVAFGERVEVMTIAGLSIDTAAL